jgi:hypothetical protein
MNTFFKLLTRVSLVSNGTGRITETVNFLRINKRI